MTDFFSVLSL